MKSELEAAGIKTDFPVAETPAELAKIEARRMAGGSISDDDDLGSTCLCSPNM